MSFPAPPQNVKVLTVGELTRGVKALLEDAFPLVWVAGEISNLARPASGHVYLSLKDAESQVRAVMWRGSALRLRFDPRDGQDVIVRGRLSVYPPRGEYQLVIEELHVKGLGAQELALRQLKEKLFKLGYFDPARKKSLPRFPRRLALVTSPTGAAVRDMLEILARRWPMADIWVCPARVQGDGAAQDMARVVRLLNRLNKCGNLELDAMILGRGGGSTEDLWEFNAECLAQAIYDSQVPVVSAVGHEIDVTIADLVADLRALTPSQAATVVVPDAEELSHGLTDYESRMRLGLLAQLEAGRRRLDDLAARRAFRLPLERVHDQEQRLDDWSDRLRRSVRQRLALAKERLEAQAGQLESLSPLNVLSRGYSLTRREVDQVVVRGSEQVHPGDRLVTTVQHGRIISRVEGIEPAAS
ncbi:MAG: exodeoxyribonuclease VII large subunit [Gemmataceae bacterium]|nr:exodeoxyribonuclease VII large subunit [Gemmataceae bacterium]